RSDRYVRSKLCHRRKILYRNKTRPCTGRSKGRKSRSIDRKRCQRKQYLDRPVLHHGAGRPFLLISHRKSKVWPDGPPLIRRRPFVIELTSPRKRQKCSGNGFAGF